MFRFQVSTVQRLPRANVALIEGTLLEGTVFTGDIARVAASPATTEFGIKGVVRLSGPLADKQFSLTVALHQVAHLDIAQGDVVESC